MKTKYSLLFLFVLGIAIGTKAQVPDYRNASDDNPVDMTSLIVNAGYDNGGTGWSGTKATIDGDARVAEFSGTIFDYYQDIKGLPAGYYLLNVQGFYRAGTALEDYTTYLTNPGSQKNALFYAGSIGLDKSHYYATALKNLAEEAEEGEAITGYVYATDGVVVANNGQTAALEFLKEKYYDNFVFLKLEQGATLRIGLRKAVVLANDWTAADNWTLFYTGEDSELEYFMEEVELPAVEVENPLGELLEKASTLVSQRMYKALNQQLQNAISTYQDETDPAKLAVGEQTLTSLISQAEASITGYQKIYSLLDIMNNVIFDNETIQESLLAEAQTFHDDLIAKLDSESLDAKGLDDAEQQISVFMMRLSQNTLAITTTQAGTLSSLLAQEYSDLTMVRRLSVAGPINSTDLSYIRSQMRTTLEVLDLKDATIATINSSAMTSMTALTSLTLPRTTTTINSSAFSSCKVLEEVVLPEELVSLGSNVFNNCTSLTDIVYISTLPATPTSNIINGTQEANCNLWVPAIAINLFKGNTYWNKFNVKGIAVDELNIASELELNTDDPQHTAQTLSLVMRDKGSGFTAVNRYQFGALNVTGNARYSLENFETLFDPHTTMTVLTSSNTATTRTSASLINNASMRADNVTVNLMLRAYRWSFVCLPFDISVADINNIYDVPFVIYKYDGRKRAAADMNNTWVRMTADSTLHAGEGYIWQPSAYVNAQNTTINNILFKLKAQNTVNKGNIFANDNVDVKMNEYVSETVNNRSWNLVGNPYPCFFDSHAMDTTTPFTVWNLNSQNYEAYSPVDDQYIFMPGEAFFIQRPVDQASITFNKEGRQSDRTAREAVYFASSRQSTTTVRRSVFNLWVDGNGQSDRTRLVINEQALREYEMSRDASKFASMGSSLQLCTIEQGESYAINERPLADGEVRLGITFATPGTYTLRMDTKSEDQVYLTDLHTGTEVLLNEDGYTFEAQAGNDSDRFMLHVVKNGTTSIMDTAKARAEKNTHYNIGGQHVDVPSKGLYIVNGRKVVVR